MTRFCPIVKCLEEKNVRKKKAFKRGKNEELSLSKWLTEGEERQRVAEGLRGKDTEEANLKAERLRGKGK